MPSGQRGRRQSIRQSRASVEHLHAPRVQIGVMAMRPPASTCHRSLGGDVPFRVAAIQSAIRIGGNGPRFAAGTLPTEWRASWETGGDGTGC